MRGAATTVGAERSIARLDHFDVGVRAHGIGRRVSYGGDDPGESASYLFRVVTDGGKNHDRRRFRRAGPVSAPPAQSPPSRPGHVRAHLAGRVYARETSFIWRAHRLVNDTLKPTHQLDHVTRWHHHGYHSTTSTAQVAISTGAKQYGRI